MQQHAQAPAPRAPLQAAQHQRIVGARRTCGVPSLYPRPIMRILVTGGAGFIGSSIALELAARHPEMEVLAADNLYRRGSELNLPRLKAAGVAFHHADVRQLADLLAIGPFDALVECSAEPSVMASHGGGAD